MNHQFKVGDLFLALSLKDNLWVVRRVIRTWGQGKVIVDEYYYQRLYTRLIPVPSTITSSQIQALIHIINHGT